MEVVIGGMTILSMVAVYKVRSIGFAVLERRVAKWLLADARSWDAKAEAKKKAEREFAKLG